MQEKKKEKKLEKKYKERDREQKMVCTKDFSVHVLCNQIDNKSRLSEPLLLLAKS